MQILFLLKLFGSKLVAQELATVITHHVSAQGLTAMADRFAAGAKGCQDGSAEEVAQSITDLLFSIK